MKIFDRTCVRFVPLTTEKDYIIIASSKTCSSYVGRQNTEGGQPVMISIGHGVDIDFNQRYTDAYDVSSIATLVKQLRNTFDSEAFDAAKPRLLLSVTLHYTSFWADVDAPKLEQFVDFVHVAAYNLGKTVTETKTVSHHSPTKGGPFGGVTQQNMVIQFLL
ncbi:hypothetical protein BV898_19511 [Hypsibius exemplaris]|uniref:GH18 domain-containing protein n=1 Tax=Hypsibius exemplaris TaxID=2072580 RepID=A0A9X6NL21_HYPEX|nr:hypothetical protein BV898_19511 [Hypsibius exemplaris]